MRAYVDSSVILRVVLGQADRLGEWEQLESGVASRLVEVECLRTLDRLRLSNARISDEDLAMRRGAVFRIIEGLQLVELSPPIVARAAQPMAAPLRSLGAIHLATAQMWRSAYGKELYFATHDRALAIAAIGDGFRVIGS